MLVKISLLDPGYPAKLLSQQIQSISTGVGNPVRGVQVTAKPLANSTVVQGLFAIDGLVDSKTGLLRLNPIVRAFMGAPSPYTIHQMLVDYDGQFLKPNGIESFNNKAIEVHRSVTGPSIEYQISLLTQDPSSVDIPLTKTPESPPVRSSPGIDWTTVAIFVVAALAAGALVYCLLIWSLGGRKNQRVSNRLNR